MQQVMQIAGFQELKIRHCGNETSFLDLAAEEAI